MAQQHTPRSGAVIGDRVVVRYLLGESTPADWRGNPDAAQSDVTGFLIDDADPVRLERDGEVVSIPAAAITSVKLLSAKPVRNKEIRALEGVAARSWPGVETAWIAGWFVRAGHGFSRRANSAIPLDMSAHPDATTLGRIAQWYADRDLRPLLALPERLLKASVVGGVEDVEVQMLTCDVTVLTGRLGEFGSDAVRLADEPDADWLAAYTGHRSGGDTDAARQVVTAGDGPPIFAAIVDAESSAVTAIGRGVVTESPDGRKWLGLSALWTDPERRRSGLSTRVLAALVAWGADHGADAAYLQVETTNRVAGAWYRRLGFGLHHTYRYITPDVPSPDPALREH
ncbi:N-acetylglutamate synthase, CG3035 family [Gordonia westfalica]|uniref:Acetyltransferase (GNAT) family protein n=1 Tax=Gordonia westfalica TaxID=158898 RepID=A0A1H2KFZ2_9ACTN|nr:GNAT family N-acetyltransferase [Gordonia westfalica]SDU67235.1 Acetyltransferase (GNAT) family protein [Gordonia westfalica]